METVKLPEYWKKHRNRISKEFYKKLSETANREPEVKDEFGEYKTGTFLFGSMIVTVMREDNLWSVHIFNENAITSRQVREVRNKFIPDKVVMAQLYGSREQQQSMKGVVLYEIPGGAE